MSFRELVRKSHVRLPIGLILPLVMSVEKTSIRKLPTRKSYVKLPIEFVKCPYSSGLDNTRV